MDFFHFGKREQMFLLNRNFFRFTQRLILPKKLFFFPRPINLVALTLPKTNLPSIFFNLMPGPSKANSPINLFQSISSQSYFTLAPEGLRRPISFNSPSEFNPSKYAVRMCTLAFIHVQFTRFGMMLAGKTASGRQYLRKVYCRLHSACLPVLRWGHLPGGSGGYRFHLFKVIQPTFHSQKRPLHWGAMMASNNPS